MLFLDLLILEDTFLKDQVTLLDDLVYNSCLLFLHHTGFEVQDRLVTDWLNKEKKKPTDCLNIPLQLDARVPDKDFWQNWYYDKLTHTLNNNPIEFYEHYTTSRRRSKPEAL